MPQFNRRRGYPGGSSRRPRGAQAVFQASGRDPRSSRRQPPRQARRKRRQTYDDGFRAGIDAAMRDFRSRSGYGDPGESFDEGNYRPSKDHLRVGWRL